MYDAKKPPKSGDDEEKSKTKSIDECNSAAVDQLRKLSDGDEDDANNKDDESAACASDSAVVDGLLSDVASNFSDLGLDDAAELERFDMMIQSAGGPFQHPRASQAYGHGAANSYRHQSYHQVNKILQITQKIWKLRYKIFKYINKLNGTRIRSVCARAKPNTNTYKKARSSRSKWFFFENITLDIMVTKN